LANFSPGFINAEGVANFSPGVINAEGVG